jgi:N-acetylglucosaminyldiphosphoundecaprenol N-acetyl-beta-D-mannosaminyltransferase
LDTTNPLPAEAPAVRYVLGTPLCLTNYADFARFCQTTARLGKPVVVDFSNTQIVAMRRGNRAFRQLTGCVDFFVPDGMPLVWCLNRQGARLRDRVYGPTFMRTCLANSPATVTHYFLGGSEDCLQQLQRRVRQNNPNLRIVGARNGYFQPADNQAIVDEINQLAPDCIWVGLGTPKQQAWIAQHKGKIRRGVILAVGFAFDVNAGTKPDAPAWMQRCGLTWLFRLVTEPARLGPRYLKYNALFLLFLLWDGLRGRAFAPFESNQV